MRNLMRRALDRLTGGASPKKGADQAKKAAAGPGKRAADAPPAHPPEPQSAAGTHDKRAPPAGGRNALIEKALAIQRDQARIFDELQPAERKRLQALARRTFAPVLKDEPEPARKPSAPASPAKPTNPPGRRRP